MSDPLDVVPARPVRRPTPHETIVYDRRCRRCRRLVRSLATGARSAGFRVASLDGSSFRAAVPEAVRRGIALGLVVVSAGRTPLCGWAAMRHVLGRIGGRWWLLAALMRVVPAALGEMLWRAPVDHARPRPRALQANPGTAPASG